VRLFTLGSAVVVGSMAAIANSIAKRRPMLGCLMSLWVIAVPLEVSAQEAEASADPSAEAGAPPTRNQCLQAHVQTQKAQADGELLSSQQHARICTHPACPSAVIVDCSSWLDELEPRIPSLVFEVRRDGELNTSARIHIDGQPVAEWMRGQALPVNPGSHQVRVTLEPYPPVVHTVLVADGMKFRVVSAEFRSAASATAKPEAVPVVDLPAPTTPTRSVPLLVYPLAGLGAVALGSFVGFTLSANAEYDRLSERCAPFCSDDQMRAVRRRYLIGDLSLGASALSVAGAALLYFTRPTLVPGTPTVGFAPVRAGGMALITLQTR
jgi:hypothetical protein